MFSNNNDSKEILLFPNPELADEDGLLAIGGFISPATILQAYSQGIFPWYEGEVPLWYHPDPRFVLRPSQLKVSKSMQKLLLRNAFHFSVNTDFKAVIHACKSIQRPGQDGTWISSALENAFLHLHEKGIAHSAEVRLNGALVGGLYGLLMGNIFFGESMFSTQSNASKYALICWVKKLQDMGVVLIDCQVHTNHLESMGANMISRKKFIEILEKEIGRIDDSVLKF